MSERRRVRQTLVLGGVIAVWGILCLGGGIVLLVWRLTQPDQAARLLPVALTTPQPTPTPGVFGTLLSPPPLPEDLAQVVILPVSEGPSPVPTLWTAPPPAALPATQAEVPAPTVTSTAAPLGVPTLRPMSPTPPRTRIAPSPSPRPSVTPAPTAAPLPALIPERIVIPRVNLEAPIVPVGQHAIQIGVQVFSQWDVPRQRAAGWHQNSAAIGQAGNLVLNGHHNIYGEVFRYLVLLEPGDVITLETRGEPHRYIVVQTMTLAEQDEPAAVRQANARWVLPTTDERVTLVTCWPYYANTHRLVVIARPFADVVLVEDIP